MHRLIFLSAALCACHGTDMVPPQGVAASCGTAAPEITELLVEDGDPFTVGADQVPGMNINVRFSDADQDLQWFEVRIWWDDVLDGVVDPVGPFYEAYGHRGDLDCGVPFTEVPLRIAVNGNPPADHDIEVGAIAYDDMGNPSNGGVPMVTAYHTQP